MYDLIIIGAGPAGYPAAIKTANLGKKVAVVDGGLLGGTCLNKGCVPTKTLLHITELYKEVLEGERFGIVCQAPTMDYNKMWDHKEKTLQGLRDGIATQFKKSGVDFFPVFATITGEKTVTLADGSVLEGSAILVATGTKPATIPIEGIELAQVINSDHILGENRLGKDSSTIYKNVVIVGGGVIGMEMATVYNNLGSNVVVIEAMDRILPTMDKEISQNLKMIMKKRGVEIISSAKLQSITETNGELLCTYLEKDKEKTITTDGVLISVGRKATTEGLFTGDLSDKISMERGYIVTDDNFKTSVEGIYAVGDVIGKIQLAHMATAQGLKVVSSLFSQENNQDLSLVPSCVYTNPEIATIGITADEAKAQGIEVDSHKYIMSVNAKSVLSLSDRGFIKIITAKEDGRVLGGQLMCQRATDMIGEVGILIANGLTADSIAKLIHPHPTFCEGISECVNSSH